jgi:hypothetical protein
MIGHIISHYRIVEKLGEGGIPGENSAGRATCGGSPAPDPTGKERRLSELICVGPLVLLFYGGHK